MTFCATPTTLGQDYSYSWHFIRLCYLCPVLTHCYYSAGYSIEDKG